VRILVTNDDGIDSVGLHALATALMPLGEVLVVAPDTEYSGAGAAIGPIHITKPVVQRIELDGREAWTVNGPPGLCAYIARLGAFGPPPELVVSGINPGANVGRAIYHSGTVGAALTARNGGLPGIAVSQEVAFDAEIEGQGFEAALGSQLWESAATVAAQVVAGFQARPPRGPVVLNVNVPNLPVDEIKGWRYCDIGRAPSRGLTGVRLEPRPGHERTFTVVMEAGDRNVLPPEVDGGAVEDGYVSLSWLSRIEHQPIDGTEGIDAALDTLLTR
jgi:5'-nucleotidase